jgi:hypothetical protein
MDFPDTDETRACTTRGRVSSETTTTTTTTTRSFVRFARLVVARSSPVSVAGRRVDE